MCTGFKETVDEDDEVAEEKEDSRIKAMRVDFLALTAIERLIDSDVVTPPSDSVKRSRTRRKSGFASTD